MEWKAVFKILNEWNNIKENEYFDFNFIIHDKAKSYPLTWDDIENESKSKCITRIKKFESQLDSHLLRSNVLKELSYKRKYFFYKNNTSEVFIQMSTIELEEEIFEPIATQKKTNPFLNKEVSVPLITWYDFGWSQFVNECNQKKYELSYFNYKLLVNCLTIIKYFSFLYKKIHSTNECFDVGLINETEYKEISKIEKLKIDTTSMDNAMIKNQIVAIFSSDIVDSSKYATDDHNLYLQIHTLNREIHLKIFEVYKPILKKESGDGYIALFSSNYDSVCAARDILKEVQKINTFKIRIGIHFGDTTIEESDAQGLNVIKACRIQTVSTNNNLFVSQSVYLDLENRPDIKFEYAGEYELKNIPNNKLYRLVNGINETPKPANLKIEKNNQYENLNSFEKVLIKEATQSKKCNIIKASHQKGLVIQVDDKVLFRGNNSRRMLVWEEAFDNLLAQSILKKKGTSSYTLTSKGYEIGDQLQPQIELGVNYDSWDNAFLTISKINFFLNRIQDSFPAVRKLTWFTEPKIIIDRLEILLRPPLKFFPIDRFGDISDLEGPEAPLWWFRGGSNLEIEKFLRISDEKCIIGFKELKVNKLAVCLNANDTKSFVYLQVFGEKSVFDLNTNNGDRSTEEYAIFEEHIITREEYDDGSALINGKVISIMGKAKLRYRHLKPYNFIICAKSSDFNSHEYNQPLRFFLDQMLQEEELQEAFESSLEGLVGLDITTGYRGPE